MITIIKIQSELPLAGPCPVRYQGIAHNGCWFFLTQRNDPEIVQLDSCFRVAARFPTCRCYACLCYDPCACCFWASDDRCPSVLYRLDECFREVDFIRLQSPQSCGGIGIITSISYDCKEHCLLLSTSSELIWVSVKGSEGRITCVQTPGLLILSAVAAGGCYFFSFLAKGKQMVRYCSRDGKVLWEQCVPGELSVNAAVFARGSSKCRECSLFVLVSKHGCYSYLLECVPVSGAFAPELCCCPCKPKPPCPDRRPCEELLESVALMQTALSRILNAESEKMQKIIASSDDPDTLLEANQAVNRVLVDATFLEQALYHKLELIRDLCEPCNPESEDACGA